MSGLPSIPPEWVLNQTVYHRFLLWVVWKANGPTVQFSIREVAFALHISKTAAERALGEATLEGMLQIAPVPITREGATYNLKKLLGFVSQEVSQESGGSKFLGQLNGQKVDKAAGNVIPHVNDLNSIGVTAQLIGLGQLTGHLAGVPPSVPPTKPTRRLPMSKRDKDREKMLGKYHPDTKSVFEQLTEIWPDERSNGSKIGCPFADTVARIDEKLQDGIPAADLVEAAKLYLQENSGYESEIRFFLGPGKPGSGAPKWAKYVKAIRFTKPAAQASAM